MAGERKPTHARCPLCLRMISNRAELAHVGACSRRAIARQNAKAARERAIRQFGVRFPSGANLAFWRCTRCGCSLSGGHRHGLEAFTKRIAAHLVTCPGTEPSGQIRIDFDD